MSRDEGLTEAQEIFVDILILRNTLLSKFKVLDSFELSCILVGLKMLCDEVALLKCEVERTEEK